MIEIIATLEDRYKFFKLMSLEENYQQYVTNTTGNLLSKSAESTSAIANLMAAENCSLVPPLNDSKLYASLPSLDIKNSLNSPASWKLIHGPGPKS